MARFILNNDYHLLSFTYCTDDPNDQLSISVTEMYPNSNGPFRPHRWTTAYLHPRKTGNDRFGTKFYNELEIYGVAICGEKLQQLIEDLKGTTLNVNRQGLCFSFLFGYRDRDSAYYPVHGLFNWRKYGVSNVPYPPTELWSGIGRIIPKPHEFNSFDNCPSSDADQSKEIRLNADDLFISCGSHNYGPDGPLYLWKVDSPSGHIKKVQFMVSIDCHRDMSRLEVNGVTLQGGKLRSLCKELKANNRMLVNAGGWCLYASLNSKHYHKLVFRFNWETYGVPTHIWGPNKYYTDEVETIREWEIQKICVSGGAKDEQNTYGLDLEKIKEQICQKEKELKDLESQLQEKNKDSQKQLDEKDQELKNLTQRLHAVQNEVIIGSIYREYCSNDSFEKRLQNLSAVSREMHVVLAFARDYDDWDNHTNGIFKVFFNQNVTPLMITNFKRDWPTTKFFLCIGDRSNRYPFHVTDKHTWIINATTSLKSIIQDYGFDGIDVYYTSSNSTNADDFIYTIGMVIDTLKTQKIITTASIAPCSFMDRPDCNFYAGLYNRNPKIFEFVVFQTHDDDNDIPMNDAQQLINIFNKLASDDNFPKEKLVAGHSILPEDWDTLPYPVILTALPQLIKSGVVQGTSVWALTDDQP